MDNENNEENDKKYFEKDSDGDEIEEGMNFAQMLDSYESGMKDDIRVGDKIRGRIVSITGGIGSITNGHSP